MEVNAVTKKKKELEKAICVLIQTFEKETGCHVDSNGKIYYTRSNMVANASVQVDVSIR